MLHKNKESEDVVKQSRMDVEFLRYQYEDGYDGVVTKSKFKIGVRHVQMFYMTVCVAAIGVARGCSGIAVLAVVDNTRRNDTYIQTHDWDKRVQGMVLSSFFFGYAVILVPAELYLRKIGGKLLLTAILVANGAMYVAMPTIINKGGWIAVCNAQLLLGMTQACVSPINHCMLEKWVPPSEKSLFGCIIYSGNILGIIIALPLAGLISEARLGWELIFYSLAMMMLSMGAICGLLTASTPDQHQALGDTEKEYIKESLSRYKRKPHSKPWRLIIASSRFWGISCAHAGTNAVFVFYLVTVPAYFNAMGITLRDVAWYSMLPFISMWIVYIITSPTIDWIYRFGMMTYMFNITHFRKFINALGGFGMAIGLMVLPCLGPQINHFAIVLLIGTFSLLGLQFSGFLKNHRDMTENYAGSLLMMTSAVSSLAGAAVPFVTGLILGNNTDDLQRWRIVFFAMASFCILCNIIYTVLSSSEREVWDDTGTKQRYQYHNGIIDANIIELDELGHTKLPLKISDDDTLL